MKNQVMDKSRIAALAVLFVLAGGVLGHLHARNSRARNNDEIEIYAEAISSEVNANRWADSDVICFSVDGKDPNKKLVEVLRNHKLNVRSLGEWPKKTACGFSVWLEIVTFDSDDDARIRIQSSDLRDINTGSAHFATELRQGEYSMKKVGGRWTVAAFTPKDQPQN
jgi:hypothetical protein